MTAANTDKIRKSTNNFTTTLSSSIINTDTTMTLPSVSGLDTANAIDLVIDRVDANRNPTPAKREYIVGVVAGSTITSMLRGKGGSTALPHASGAIVEAVSNAQVQNDLADAITTTLNQDGTLKSSLTITTPSITTPTLTTPKVITSINDTNGNELISVSPTASAVNQVNVTNAATGTGPTVSAVGGDTNIDLNFAPKGTGQNKGVVDHLYNPYKFSVYRNAALSIVSSGEVPCDTKVFDTGSNVDIVTNKGRFTAPVSGFYQFDGNVGFSVSGNNGVAYASALRVNSSTLYSGFSFVNTYTGSWTIQCPVSKLLLLTAGDFVELYVTASAGGGGTGIQTGVGATFFDGFLVSTT